MKKILAITPLFLFACNGTPVVVNTPVPEVKTVQNVQVEPKEVCLNGMAYVLFDDHLEQTKDAQGDYLDCVKTLDLKEREEKSKAKKTNAKKVEKKKEVLKW